MQSSSARIVAIASYLPEKILSNLDLEKIVDTSDEWITTRTGIKERRVAEKGEGSAAMGAEAAKRLLAKINRSADSIDLILVATMTPDFLAPSNAALIQSMLHATRAAAFDFQAACTGFVYGLSIAKAFIEAKVYRSVLLIATEKMTSFIDYADRNTCILFGDGASAALIEAKGSGLLIDSVCLGADGENPKLAWIPAGGALHPPSIETIQAKEHFFKMEGKELFKHAVRRMAAAARECLARSQLSESDISWIVPHQANARIIDAVGKTFSIDPKRVYRTIHKYGNTSASSIAIALDELLQEHELKANELILLAAFGAGLTWGAATLKKIV